MLSHKVAAVSFFVLVGSLIWSQAEGQCQATQFNCGTECIPHQQVCDGIMNCMNGRDENKTVTCGCTRNAGPRPRSKQNPARGGCACISTTGGSVVCGCSLGLIPDGQNGCRAQPGPRPSPVPRPSTRPRSNSTAPAGRRTRRPIG